LILAVDADQYIVDGNLKLSNLGRKARRVQSLIRADEIEQAVSAASIIAKVTRDHMMADLHEAHPVYGWNHNAGYCTQEHLQALRTYGPTTHHRHQFVTTALSRSNPMLPGFDKGAFKK